MLTVNIFGCKVTQHIDPYQEHKNVIRDMAQTYREDSSFFGKEATCIEADYDIVCTLQNNKTTNVYKCVNYIVDPVRCILINVFPTPVE